MRTERRHEGSVEPLDKYAVLECNGHVCAARTTTRLPDSQLDIASRRQDSEGGLWVSSRSSCVARRVRDGVTGVAPCTEGRGWSGFWGDGVAGLAARGPCWYPCPGVLAPRRSEEENIPLAEKSSQVGPVPSAWAAAAGERVRVPPVQPGETATSGLRPSGVLHPPPQNPRGRRVLWRERRGRWERRGQTPRRWRRPFLAVTLGKGAPPSESRQAAEATSALEAGSVLPWGTHTSCSCPALRRGECRGDSSAWSPGQSGGSEPWSARRAQAECRSVHSLRLPLRTGGTELSPGARERRQGGAGNSAVNGGQRPRTRTLHGPGSGS